MVGPCWVAQDKVTQDMVKVLEGIITLPGCQTLQKTKSDNTQVRELFGDLLAHVFTLRSFCPLSPSHTQLKQQSGVGMGRRFSPLSPSELGTPVL
jgi:hypothetical protein